MANQEYLDILKQGVETWNQWRQEHPDILVDLSRADLRVADLRFANLCRVNLSRADLSDANLSDADLSSASLNGVHLCRADLRRAKLNGASLSNADFSGAFLNEAHLNGADLRKADFSRARLNGARLISANLTEAHLNEAHLNGANLSFANLRFANLRFANLRFANLISTILRDANLRKADFSGADLSGADLIRAILVETDLREATLNHSYIYGISAWNVELEGAKQDSLVITPPDQSAITVDNLEVAQFIYLLLNNPKIRDVIDTIARKAVLILGRFTPERKAVLNALREALRTHEYLPILFDFEKPASLDLTETVSTLAHLSRFIIADLTEPSSIPKELEAIVPTLAVPVQPLLEGSTRPYAMFKDYWKYQWVLEVYRYDGLEELLASLKEHVIEPAERKAKELVQLRAQEFEKW
jgi:uncharacterized protein YjbI with pentapeptide repeats